MSVSDYAYLNAKIHGKKSKFLSAKDYERLYNASSAEEMYRLISTASIASDELSNVLLSNAGFSARDIDQILIKDFQNRIGLMSRQLPQYTQTFIREYEKRYFLEALKILIKAKHFNMSEDEVEQLVVLPSKKYRLMFDQLLKLQTVNNIAEQVPVREYKVALQEALSDYEQQQDPLVLELALYSAYFKKLWSSSYTLKLSDKASVFGIIGTEVDLINVLAIIRAKKLGIEPDFIGKWLIKKTHKLPQHAIEAMKNVGSINQIEPILRSVSVYKELSQQVSSIFESSEISIEAIERKFKEHLVHKSIQMISANPFQLGIFFGYLNLAQTEFTNIRAIIIGKMANLSGDDIKDSILYF